MDAPVKKDICNRECLIKEGFIKKIENLGAFIQDGYFREGSVSMGA